AAVQKVVEIRSPVYGRSSEILNTRWRGFADQVLFSGLRALLLRKAQIPLPEVLRMQQEVNGWNVGKDIPKHTVLGRCLEAIDHALRNAARDARIEDIYEPVYTFNIKATVSS